MRDALQTARIGLEKPYTMQTDKIAVARITMVSAFADHVDLMRKAFAGSRQSPDFLQLASRSDVEQYFKKDARPADPDTKDFVLLDIDTAPETSWWFIERSTSNGQLPAPAAIALVSPKERTLAEARFGTSVSNYLPIPETPAQARHLVDIIDAFRGQQP